MALEIFLHDVPVLIPTSSKWRYKSTESVAEAQHQVVLLLEVQKLIADIKEESIRDTYLEIGKLV